MCGGYILYNHLLLSLYFQCVNCEEATQLPMCVVVATERVEDRPMSCEIYRGRGKQDHIEMTIDVFRYTLFTRL